MSCLGADAGRQRQYMDDTSLRGTDYAITKARPSSASESPHHPSPSYEVTDRHTSTSYNQTPAPNPSAAVSSSARSSGALLGAAAALLML